MPAKVPVDGALRVIDELLFIDTVPIVPVVVLVVVRMIVTPAVDVHAVHVRWPLDWMLRLPSVIQ
jgi:hypothetical protein